MELTGEHRIPAPRQVVWDALHDPQLLKECIKGCESLDLQDDGTMKAKVTAKVGPVKATFDANVEIVNAVPPESYTLQGEGKGGVAGFANGSADVKLTEDGDATVLAFDANAKIGGKLAQLGSRLVDSTAKRYAADFFTCLSEKVGGAETAATAPAEAAAPAPEAMQPTVAPTATPTVPPVQPSTSTPPAAEGGAGFPTWGWVVIAVIAIALAAFLFA